jgi:hypothetical protein
MIPDQPRATLNNRMVVASFVISLIAIPGLILLAFFNMGPTTIMIHAAGATMFFVGTVIMGGLFWLCIEMHKESTLVLRVCSLTVFAFFVCFIAAVVMLVVQNPAEMQAFLASPTGYIAQILGNSTSTKLAWIRFFEWWYILAMVAWNIYLGYHAVKIAHKRHGALSTA